MEANAISVYLLTSLRSSYHYLAPGPFHHKKNEGFPQRFNHELLTVQHQLDQYNSPQRALCITDFENAINTQCLMGTKKAPRKHALMIGDSFSNHYWGFMDVLGQAANVSILMQTVSSCLTLPDIYLYDWWHFKNKSTRSVMSSQKSITR